MRTALATRRDLTLCTPPVTGRTCHWLAGGLPRPGSADVHSSIQSNQHSPGSGLAARPVQLGPRPAPHVRGKGMLCPEQSGPQMRVDYASSWPAASHPASVEAKYGGPVPSTLCQGRARQHEPLRPIVLLLVTVRPAPRPEHGQGLVRRAAQDQIATARRPCCPAALV